ncbi:MAG: M1 family aminopeptidase [Acidobacteriota bacterium]
MSTTFPRTALFATVLFLSLAIFQQNAKPSSDSAVVPDDEVYKSLRSLSSSPDSFSGSYATVNNLVLKRDAGYFTLKTGTVYFLKPIENRVTGAVFIGSGEFSLNPPIAVERKHLEIFVGTSIVRESFDTLTMFFTDDTFEAIKSSPDARMGTGGPQAEKARTTFRGKESVFRNTLFYNITSRILSDIYAPHRKGFFSVFIDGGRVGKLVFAIDPLGHAEVYPEQVELLSYGDSSGGIWTAFHMEDEYRNGTATSWQDRRIYDIKNHSLDVSISGTRIIARDEVTLEMREANARFIPFDLFRTLRVKSVKDEMGNPLVFIQEKKEEDADLGVVLPTAQPVGKPFKLVVEYDGVEALREAGSGNFILIPRSSWYPNNPASSFGDRATFDITFRTPKKLTMIGVGSRVGEETLEGDLKISKWSSEGVELAVAGFNYGDFKAKELKDPETGYTLEVYTNRVLPDEIRDIQLQIDDIRRRGGITATTLGSLATGSMAETVLVEAQNATRIYNGFFGPMPYNRIAMTQQPAGFFGQAWPTLVFMPYIAFFGDTHRVQLFGIRGGTDGFWREVAAHEVAHQWWGHLVGWTSYRDQWMSEGFSEFSTSLFIQYVKRDPAKFNAFWEEQRKRIVEATPATKGRKPFTVGPVTQGYRLNSAKTGAIAQSLIYPKGAYILQMIRMLMYDHRGGTGDVRFQKMMREFVTVHHNKDVSTNDFQLAVEKHMLPSMDLDGNGKLDWFFNQWVYGTDIPSYKLTYTVSSAGGKTVINGQLTQSGVSESFRYPVPLYLDYGKGPVYFGSARITGNKTLELKDLALSQEPKKLLIGGLQDILAEKIEITKR